MRISREYRSPAIRTAVAQCVVVLLGGMVMDGGYFGFTLLIATAAYWVGLGVVVVRRPANPSSGDLLWAKAGFAIACILTGIISPLVVQLKRMLWR